VVAEETAEAALEAEESAQLEQDQAVRARQVAEESLAAALDREESAPPGAGPDATTRHRSRTWL
jgi:hypothetical protein